MHPMWLVAAGDVGEVVVWDAVEVASVGDDGGVGGSGGGVTVEVVVMLGWLWQWCSSSWWCGGDFGVVAVEMVRSGGCDVDTARDREWYSRSDRSGDREKFWVRRKKPAG
uniref:Uncharacterized protein n=1 Tax=Tanacetum cinerariifolium TaxID=118510 RepID=A0A699KIS5_TANCI|nr:hypothetical protein [Tanacetum cinerariifolium]